MFIIMLNLEAVNYIVPEYLSNDFLSSLFGPLVMNFYLVHMNFFPVNFRPVTGRHSQTFYSREHFMYYSNFCPIFWSFFYGFKEITRFHARKIRQICKDVT